MENFFKDEFINKYEIKHLFKEVKKEQLNKTIKEIDFFNRVQQELSSKYDVTASLNINSYSNEYKQYL